MMNRRTLVGLAGVGLALPSVRVSAQSQSGQEQTLLVRDGQGQSQPVWAMGVRVTLKVLGEQTSGSYAMFEDFVPPGVSNPAHTHTREIETWYMLEGELDWFVGDQVIKAKTGDFVHTPRGVPHRFGNVSDKPARMLLTYAPAGFEKWFLEIGAPAVESAAPPPFPPTKEQIGRAVAAAERYGVNFKV